MTPFDSLFIITDLPSADLRFVLCYVRNLLSTLIYQFLKTSSFFAEYGFRFFVGRTGELAVRETAASTATFSIIMKSHTSTAASAHFSEMSKIKCKAVSTAAGISPSAFKIILNSRFGKKLPRLTLLITRDSSFQTAAENVPFVIGHVHGVCRIKRHCVLLFADEAVLARKPELKAYRRLIV